ncbi:MAG: hypothetical protein EBQ89_01870 [Alphaproteobacteria bacterium]|nr:hypothetical protein [Alphaproteobacteria bacterium]
MASYVKDTYEEWRDVPGFQGRYRVSDLGRVHSLLSGRDLRPGFTSRGYLSVVLYDGSTPKNPRSMLVHHLVAGAFLGRCEEGMTVNHKDCDKTNNRAWNLEYLSHTANVRHGIKAGVRNIARMPHDQQPDPLTPEEIRSALYLLVSGHRMRQVVETINASRSESNQLPRSTIQRQLSVAAQLA